MMPVLWKRPVPVSGLWPVFRSASQSAFCRFFKSIMHISAVTYVNNLRIAESCRLLLSTEEAISKIASDCGFRNISYFNRVFQERMHQTPGQFRSLSAENRTAI